MIVNLQKKQSAVFRPKRKVEKQQQIHRTC